jgi:hypothetical protein
VDLKKCDQSFIYNPRVKSIKMLIFFENPLIPSINSHISPPFFFSLLQIQWKPRSVLTIVLYYACWSFLIGENISIWMSPFRFELSCARDGGMWWIILHRGGPYLPHPGTDVTNYLNVQKSIYGHDDALVVAWLMVKKNSRTSTKERQIWSPSMQYDSSHSAVPSAW